MDFSASISYGNFLAMLWSCAKETDDNTLFPLLQHASGSSSHNTEHVALSYIATSSLILYVGVMSRRTVMYVMGNRSKQADYNIVDFTHQYR
jgi:hypothetical protein